MTAPTTSLQAMTTAILKVTSTCNLNCSYCYMFNGTDTSHRGLPGAMSRATATRVVERIAEWSAATGQSRFHLVIHGGEPTLWPPADLAALATAARALPDVDVSLTIQTNGVHLSTEFLDVVAEHAITLGISIDGPEDVNDVRRVNHQGHGSYRAIMRSVDRLMRHDAARYFGGFLCVTDPTIAPDRFFDWILTLPRRSINLILPMEFNHDRTPWDAHHRTRGEYAVHPVYGVWLSALFDLWFDRADPGISITVFEDIIGLLIGGLRCYSDNLVNNSLDGFVINTAGGYEYHDYVRNAYDGACRTPFDVHTDSFARFSADPVLRTYLHLGELLPDECRACPIVDVCGGGLVTGRLAAGPGLPIPVGRSVLCFDQFALTGHILTRIAPSVAGELLHGFRPAPLTAAAAPTAHHPGAGGPPAEPGPP